MANVTGVVSRKNSKPTRNGKMMYSIQVDGNWYGGMFDDPGCNEGDTVSFESSQNGAFSNVAKGTLQVVQGQQQPNRQAQTGNTVGGGGAGREQYWEQKAKDDAARQISIAYQSARKDAIEVVKIMVANDLITQPTKKGDKYDWMLGLVDVLTDRFQKDVEDIGEYGQRTGEYEITGEEDQGDGSAFGE